MKKDITIRIDWLQIFDLDFNESWTERAALQSAMRNLVGLLCRQLIEDGYEHSREHEYLKSLCGIVPQPFDIRHDIGEKLAELHDSQSRLPEFRSEDDFKETVRNIYPPYVANALCFGERELNLAGDVLLRWYFSGESRGNLFFAWFEGLSCEIYRCLCDFAHLALHGENACVFLASWNHFLLRNSWPGRPVAADRRQERAGERECQAERTDIGYGSSLKRIAREYLKRLGKKSGMGAEILKLNMELRRAAGGIAPLGKGSYKAPLYYWRDGVGILFRLRRYRDFNQEYLESIVKSVLEPVNPVLPEKA